MPSSGTSGLAVLPAGANALALLGVVDVQVFNPSSGSFVWTKPASGSHAYITATPAGGGGGSGAIGAGSVYGGAGGSGGQSVILVLPLTALGASLTVQVGSGGAGGAASSGATGTVGGDGSADTIFDTVNSIIVCPHGLGGGAGGLSASTGGAAPSVATISVPAGYPKSSSLFGQQAGGNGSITTFAGAGTGPSGGAGGGVSVAPTGLAGGQSGTGSSPVAVAAFPGTANTTTRGGDATLALASMFARLAGLGMWGGAGSGGNNGAGTGRGGDGYSGGGGGGSGSATSGTTGRGGNGGDGLIVVSVI